MKTILLLNPPGTKKYFRDYYCSSVSKAKYYYHPVDLVYLSGRVATDYTVKVIDAIAETLPPLETIERAQKMAPDYIIFLISSPSYDEDVAFLHQLKLALPQARFIGTGDIYRELGEKSFEIHDFLDAVLLDFSTDDIMVYLRQEHSGSVINNMIYKENGAIIAGPEKHGHGEYYMPIPQWDLFPLEKYVFPFSRRGKYATVLTDFGCPFGCSFCPMSTLSYKLRDIDTVLAEIRLLKMLGISELLIRDQTFGVNKARTYLLCDKIIAEKLDISWTCFGRVDIVDEEFLRKIKKAGCHTIMYGIETVNETLLKEYGKNIKVKQISDALTLSKKVGLRTVGTFIIGLPGETKASILNTVAFARKIDLDYASFNIAMPRFGTRFRDDVVSKGLIKNGIQQMDSGKGMPQWQISEVSNDDIFDLQKTAIRSFYCRPLYLLKRLLHIRTLYELKEHFLEALALLR